MIVDTITEAKAHFSALIEQVQRGEEIVIKKAGVPVAVIRPYQAQNSERLPGALAGKIKISPDFDELPPDLAKAFGMEA